MAGIYVHIPFCHSKCAYCDFYSMADSRRMPGFADALAREWHARRGQLGDSAVRTIYFGGGTPSMLPADMFAGIAALFPKENVEEFTVEANPEDIEPALVETWLQAGVNRVSIGVQSLVDSELEAVGRRHSAADAVNAIRCLHDCGVENVSADLIYGLPGQTLDTWRRSVEGLLSTGIAHLSAYCLSYEPGTRLYAKLQKGLLEEADDELVEQYFFTLCSLAAEASMEHYEISNFALEGCYSRHNSAYWDGTPYLGLGPGAHSLCADGVRHYVPSDLRAYLLAPETVAVIDKENEEDRINDLLLMRLRTKVGLSIALLPEKYRRGILARAARWLKSGHLIAEGTVLRIPEDRWLTSDAVIRDLFV